MPTAEERLQLLLTEAKQVPGISVSCNVDNKPDWLDKTKFQRGQKYAASYLTRYDEDPFDPKSSAYKSFKQVQRMHSSIYKFMSDNGHMFDRKTIWLSQCDMILTQWAFIGPLLMFPKECGLHTATRDDLDDVNYLWRVLGYLNGIEDRFNLCSGTIEESQELFKLIWDKVYKPLLITNPSKIGIEMTKGIAETVKITRPLFSWSAFSNYWYKLLEMPVEIEVKGFTSNIKGSLLRFTFGTLCKSDKIRHLLSQTLRWRRKQVLKNRFQIEQTLKQKFAHIEYVHESGIETNIGYCDFEELANQCTGCPVLNLMQNMTVS